MPSQVLKKFESQNLNIKTIDLPETLSGIELANFLKKDVEKLLRVVSLREENSSVVVILPYQSLLDIKVLNDLTESEYKVLDPENALSLFKETQLPSLPAIPDKIKCRTIVDEGVLEMSEALLESGDPEKLLQVDNEAIRALFDECEVMQFAVSQDHLFAGRGPKDEELDTSFTATRLRQRVDDTFDLPAMPEIAQDIMKLRVDPSADAFKLAEIVSRDPSLAAQVISWASSPYYGYQGKIDSLETAIARVLGFELVMNLALGISIGKSLKVPMDGPLGIKAFWKQSIYCANLSEKLCRAMPIKQRPERGLIYLSGLLHNFGHLLLGHIFPPQFQLVNATILANPQVAVEDIEFYVLGITHDEIGAWLMQNWHMPDELIVAVQRHCQEEFWSKHAIYSNIVLVANRLLKRIGIGLSIETSVPQSTLDLLSLDNETIEKALSDIDDEAESLDMMAKQMVA